MIDFGITELNSRMEDARKQMETYEEDPSKRDDDWKKTLDTLIQINNHITKEAIFSENETFAEIKPEDMKYLLIPFFQGELIQKFMENRESKLDLALRFYDEFYKKLNKLEYVSKEKKESYKSLVKIEDEEEKNKKPSMDQMNQTRTEKIQMFKFKKALSEKIKKLEKEKNYDNIKEFWVSYLELCWIKMIESIKMIKLERDSIKYLKNNSVLLQSEKTQSTQSNVKKGLELLKITPDNLKSIDPNNKLLKNIEIKTTHDNCIDCLNNTHTHNNFNGSVAGSTNLNNVVENYTNVRDKVFKPSNMPTMTLDAFADKEIALAKEQEEKQKQFEMEKPDSDSEDEKVSDMKTYQAREWDDWKDDNPKGSGNRKK